MIVPPQLAAFARPPAVIRPLLGRGAGGIFLTAPLTFPASPLGVMVQLAYGADLTAHPSTWTWTDITQYVLVRDAIAMTRGRSDEQGQAEPSTCRLTLRNTSGRFTPRNPTGPYYGRFGRNTPLRVRVDPGSGYATRFAGFVSEWPPRWDASGRDQYMPIEASGVLRRLGQGASPLRSALYQSIMSTDPLAYWPLEDGRESTQAASGLRDGEPLAASSNITWAAFEVPPAGSASPPDIASVTTGGAAGTIALSGTVPVGAGTNFQWDFIAALDFGDTTGGPTLDWVAPGTDSQWAIGVDDVAGVFVRSYNPTTDTISVPCQVVQDMYDGLWHHYRTIVTRNGANTDVQLYIDGVLADTGSVVGGTTGIPSSITLRAGTPDIQGFGHIALWAPPPSPAVTLGAVTGYVGEAASARIARLCDEQDVLVEVVAGSSEAMGPQPAASTFLDLLRECEACDGGLLYETFGLTLGYRPRSTRYNAAVGMALDYTQGHLVPPLDPVDDDQRTRNDVTVERVNGSKARVVDDAHVATNGRYDSSATINVETDGVLANHAGWRVHLGTVDEMRYPRLTLDLAARPELITDWMDTDLGGRATVDNPPDDVPPDAIDVFVEGYAEDINFYDWRVTANCSPASPWTVGVLDDDVLGKLDTEGSVLADAITAVATTFDVATTAAPPSPLWTTDDTEFPFDVRCGGERMTVTDIAASLITFGATGTAAHANNASVTPGIPASVAAGNLLLCLAAIRNSGTGVPNTPAGYVRLLVFEAASNVQLFGKIATSGSETAPTITFTGGVANADTSAQMIRLTGKFHNVNNLAIRHASALNASGQDIAYPGLSIDVANCIVLYLGWKQDDWTSVAALAGATEIGEPDTTTGDDQGIVWDYVIQTTAANIPAGAFVVTGGAVAISRGAVVAIRCDKQTFTATRSVNTVVKAHSAASAVSLWTPMTLAL